MEDLAFRAMALAKELHKEQRRKYTGNPYSDHLAEVAGIVATVSLDPVHIAVAWLHDAKEDQNANMIYIEKEFGEDVASGVMWLSDLEVGNRESRKRQSRERLARAPAWVQTIKCSDLISNTGSIVMHDPKFAITYLEEKRLLLEVLTKADARLLEMARSLANSH